VRSYRPLSGPAYPRGMDHETPFFQRGYDLAPNYANHHGGPPALAWATFALVLLLSLAFFAAAISQFARRPRRPAFAGAPGKAAAPDALETLRYRYARGELSRDEFLQATADLTAAEQPPPADS
jgi:uncharacterized membrane protein